MAHFELELLQYTEKHFGGVSTHIKDLLMSYLPSVEQKQFQAVGFRITTSTFIIQLEGVSFILKDSYAAQKSKFDVTPVSYDAFTA